MSLNSSPLLSGPSGGVVDSGTTMTYGPESAILELYDRLGAGCFYLDSNLSPARYVILPCGTHNDDRYKYSWATVPCSSQIKLSFEIGGKVRADQDARTRNNDVQRRHASLVAVRFLIANTVRSSQTFDLTEEDLYQREDGDIAGEGNGGCDHFGTDYFADCVGTCRKSSEHAGWIGDGDCDSGEWGVFLNCPRLGCDSGDCHPCGEEMCLLKLDVNDFGENSWLLGDNFMRKVYVAHDVDNMRMGFSYAAVPTIEEGASPAPSPEPSVSLDPGVDDVISTSIPTVAPSADPTAAPSTDLAQRRETSGGEYNVLIGAGIVILLLAMLISFICLKRCRPTEGRFTKLSDQEEASRVLENDDFDTSVEIEFEDDDRGGGGGGGGRMGQEIEMMTAKNADPLIFEI